jgi:hypothetical protein
MKTEKIESLCHKSFRMPLSKGLDAVAGLLLNLVDKALEKYNLRSYDRLLLPCLKRCFDKGPSPCVNSTMQWDRRLIGVT